MILLIFCLVFSIYLASFKFLVFSDNFYKYEFSKGQENNLLTTKQIISFFEGNSELPDVFAKDEKYHLQDVKVLTQKGNILLRLFILFNIVLLSFLLFNSDKIKKDLSRISIFSGISGLLAILPFILFDFSSLFMRFHLIFFPQGNWQFPADSVLIQLFSESFFYDAFIFVLVSSAIIFIFLIIFGALSSKVSSD